MKFTGGAAFARATTIAGFMNWSTLHVQPIDTIRFITYAEGFELIQTVPRMSSQNTEAL
jgi:hypothetical protein